MKKVVRIVRISLLSGLAFLVACTTREKFFAHSKYETLYGSPEVKAAKTDQERIDEMNARLDRIEQGISLMKDTDNKNRSQQVDSISDILKPQEETFIEDKQEVKAAAKTDQERIDEMNVNLDRIDQCISKMGKAENTDPKLKMQQQLDSIRNIIQRREGACIYGSPEVMEQYRNETLRLHKEASKIQKQLEDLEKE